MNIAVIGWGSLLWNSGKSNRRLRRRPGVKWKRQGPALPVEFADISNDGRLTLVLHNGVALIDTYWVEHEYQNLYAARKNLARREATHLNNIQFVSLETAQPSDEICATVQKWLRSTTCEAAIWGNIHSRFSNRFGGRPFSASSAVEYLQTLSGAKLHLALEYIGNAPPQTETEVRRLVRSRFNLQERPSEFWSELID